jgi:hypothetical protein
MRELPRALLITSAWVLLVIPVALVQLPFVLNFAPAPVVANPHYLPAEPNYHSALDVWRDGYECGVNRCLDAVVLLDLELTLQKSHKTWGDRMEIVRQRLKVGTKGAIAITQGDIFDDWNDVQLPRIEPIETQPMEFEDLIGGLPRAQPEEGDPVS